MKRQRTSERQSRTRTLVQIGGLAQKSGMLDAFEIQMGENLQDYESLYKAARLLGFLCYCVEHLNESDSIKDEWQRIGELLLKRK